MNFLDITLHRLANVILLILITILFYRVYRKNIQHRILKRMMHVTFASAMNLMATVILLIGFARSGEVFVNDYLRLIHIPLAYFGYSHTMLAYEMTNGPVRDWVGAIINKIPRGWLRAYLTKELL